LNVKVVFFFLVVEMELGRLRSDDLVFWNVKKVKSGGKIDAWVQQHSVRLLGRVF